ncbi:TPA: WD40 repeat domain-containing protein [Candidatus Bipolaricaulota bacterium]|nr:WD40 repeat domain-containing protein [Candidatus Bipolaricaulota bacterium]
MGSRRKTEAVLALVALGLTLLGAAGELPPGAVGALQLRAVYGLAFSPTDGGLGVATYYGVFLYTVPELEQTRSFSLSGVAYSLAFSPDGKRLAAGTFSQVVVWDYETGEQIATYEGRFGIVYALEFTPDGEGLLIGAGDGTLTLWDWFRDEVRWSHKGHSGAVRGVAVSPAGSMCASGSADQGVLWDIDGEVRFTFPGKAWDVDFSPDSYFLAIGSGKVVILWDTAVGLQYRYMWEHHGCVWWVEFSPDGRLLASASLDHTVRIWDWEAGHVLVTLEAHQDSVECVRFSPDGRLLASGSHDGQLYLWDVEALLQGAEG